MVLRRRWGFLAVAARHVRAGLEPVVASWKVATPIVELKIGLQAQKRQLRC